MTTALQELWDSCKANPQLMALELGLLRRKAFGVIERKDIETLVNNSTHLPDETFIFFTKDACWIENENI